MSSVPLHRLSVIEKPVCNISNNDTATYKDLVDCLLNYKDRLEQSNQDKKEILSIFNKT